MKLYQYPNCSTCKKAIKTLNATDLDFESINIVENPPSKKELSKMLKSVGGEIRRLFNTSGMVYRELKLKDQLPTMSAKDAIELLSTQGKLIKRPFLLDGDRGVVGFKADEWAQFLEIK